ncbi:hypothetical protein SAMN04489740_3841 [Arthrobacter alpinus]|uniref:Uncharacterized protein n=1 Tax=Arthrobacter alpinus TaxID=656366 RepID=A0A1H5NM22_9MICC|nr:hypothetical protein SAMN04489740_3841 [Arthrobacter alpinus]
MHSLSTTQLCLTHGHGNLHCLAPALSLGAAINARRRQAKATSASFIQTSQGNPTDAQNALENIRSLSISCRWDASRMPLVNGASLLVIL